MKKTIAVLFFVATPVVAQPGRLVDVGGRAVHLHCSGHGPTAVLFAGAGAFSFDWQLVQSQLKSTFRVCTFDRAGFAWSDPPPHVVSARTVAADVSRALALSREKPPYFLVGHSYGAIEARFFHLLYPDHVAGMVLVDPSHEDMLLVVGKMGSGVLHVVRPRQYASDEAWSAVFARPRAECTCPPDSSAAKPLERTAVTGREQPKEVVRLRSWARSRPKFADYDFAYREASRKDLAELHASRSGNPRPLGDVPLIVIAADSDPADDQRLNPCQVAELRNDRPALLLDLLRLSKRAELRLAQNSTHDIHFDEPELIVEAVHRVRTARPPR